jgi:hypothetical protein
MMAGCQAAAAVQGQPAVVCQCDVEAARVVADLLSRSAALVLPTHAAGTAATAIPETEQQDTDVARDQIIPATAVRVVTTKPTATPEDRASLL